MQRAGPVGHAATRDLQAPAAPLDRERLADVLAGTPRGQRGRHRREDVAAVEGAATPAPGARASADVDRLARRRRAARRRASAARCRGPRAGAPLDGAQRDAPAAAPWRRRRVDDRQVHAGRQVRAARRAAMSAPAQHVVAGDRVGEVDHPRLRAARARSPRGRRRRTRPEPVVGEEADERRRGSSRRRHVRRGVSARAPRRRRAAPRSGRRCRGARPRRRGSRPCSRSVSLVTGPIETMRVSSAREPPAPPAACRKKRDGRGGGEGDVVGARAPARAPRGGERLGDRLVQREHVHLAPRARSASASTSRAVRGRATSARSTAASASASTSPSATKRSGTMSASMPWPASARAVPGPIAAIVAPGQRARVAAALRPGARTGSSTPFGLVRQIRS